MGNLKLTSIRLSKDSLDRAEQLSSDSRYYSTSDVLRVAIWIGLKFMSIKSIHSFLLMMFRDETGRDIITLEDVLRTAVDEPGA